jgi:hypothetical protein
MHYLSELSISSRGGVLNLQGRTMPSAGGFSPFLQGLAHISPHNRHLITGGGILAGSSAPHFLQVVFSGSKLNVLQFVHWRGFSFGGLQFPQ